MMEHVRNDSTARRSRLSFVAVPAVLAVAVMMLLSGSSVATWGLEVCAVDVGNEASEDGVPMVGWGPVVAKEGDGSWGNLDGDCRVVWASDEAEDENWATVTFEMPDGFRGACHYVSMMVLDGQAEDSFEVLVYNPLLLEWTFVYAYEAGSLKDPEGDDEQWIEHTMWLGDYIDDVWTCMVPHGHTYYLEGGFQIMIVATGPQWSGFGTYGQLAVDWISLCGSGRMQ